MHPLLRRRAAALVIAALAVAGIGFVPQAASARVQSPNCGARIAKSTGGFWQCTFDDEFNAGSLDRSKWTAQVTATSGYHSGAECFVSNSNNVSVANGTLNLTVRAEAAPFTCTDPWGDYVTQYTSGMVTTYGKFSQAYGRLEVRAKLPAVAVAGLQEAFWLWPTNPSKYGAWPASGEIDFAEGYSNYPDRVIPYVHYLPATPDPNVTTNNCLIADVAQFHTYTVEWNRSTVSISYDGQACLLDNWSPALPLVKPAPFDQPFLLALTQALGVDSNAFDRATTPLPATTQVDYVRVWS